MEPDETKKKLNDDFVEFMRKCNRIEALKYASKLRNYAKLHYKRHRVHERTHGGRRKKSNDSRHAACKEENTDATNKNADTTGNQETDGDQNDQTMKRTSSKMSRSRSGEPQDGCCCRRKRRRRSCGRRRRRRSCRRRRRSCRRRRKRSCCRRRRRRRCGC